MNEKTHIAENGNIEIGPGSIHESQFANNTHRWGKTGMPLGDLLVEVRRRSESKKDYLVRTKDAVTYANIGQDGKIVLQGLEYDAFEVTDHTHQQIATLHGIPKQFYDSLKDNHPVQHEHLVQGLFGRLPSDHSRLIRVLDGKCRAILSNSYSKYDNYDVCENILQPLMNTNQWDMKLASANVSDSRLHLKFVTDLEGNVGDDIIYAGIQITNSEIGLGSVRASLLFARIACFNISSTAMSYGKMHKGRKQLAGEEIVYSQETQALDNTAVMAKLKEEIEHMLDPEVFDRELNKYREASLIKITAKDSPYAGSNNASTPAVIEQVNKHLGIKKEESVDVLTNFFEDSSNYTVYGLSNAITTTSKTCDYDRATELEKLGHKVVELKPKEWQEIYALAAK